METFKNWRKVLYIGGIIMFIAGTIDPLEGSVIIALGSICMSIAKYASSDRYTKFFIYSAVFIIIGVAFLWFISSLGGYDPVEEWWFNILILPYPIGWLIILIILIIKTITAIKNKIVKTY